MRQHPLLLPTILTVLLVQWSFLPPAKSPVVALAFSTHDQKAPAPNPESLKTQIDEIVGPYVAKNVGLAIGIIKQGKTQLFGYGKLAKDREAQPDGNTIFEIGSATKVFTAIVLAEMVKEGLVAFDDPISKFLPTSVKAPSYEGKEITLVHLATHTSGLPRIPGNLFTTMKDAGNPYASYMVNDLYEFLSSYKLQREPGKEYDYSNIGMGLLGHILSLKSGMSYEELVVKRICDKLDMKDTRITLSPDEQRRLAPGHSVQALPVSNWDFPTLAGAGALRSTVNDMLKFVSANLGQSNASLTSVLQSCQTVRVKTSTPRLEVALGWHLVPLDESGRKIIWHNGGTGGYRSFIGFVRESATGVVVLSNTGNSVDEIGVRILKLLNGQS